jgi:hypothetical protein
MTDKITTRRAGYMLTFVTADDEPDSLVFIDTEDDDEPKRPPPPHLRLVNDSE